MALSQSRIAFVNRSSTNIPVYDGTVQSQVHAGGSTAGGNLIGHIYPDECYTVIPDNPNCSLYRIIFRDMYGDEAIGFIESSPGYTLGDHAWVEYQEPYHYYNSNGSSLISASTETIYGDLQYIFTVKKEVSYRNRNGANMGTLPVGTKLATDTSYTGQTYGSHMVFNMKNEGNGWVALCDDSYGYGFVDLGFNVGSKATNRAIW